MPIRQPAVAGLFYPDDPQRCRNEVEQYLNLTRSSSVAAALRGRRPEPAPAGSGLGNDDAAPGTNVLGGIVPHAGWAYSGAVAARSLGMTAQNPDIETIVVFGAVHRPRGRAAAVYTSGSWQTPIGLIPIDEELARAVLKASPLLVEDLAAHEPEHSIEVEVPFLQLVSPRANLLPVMVPPVADAPQIGRIVAEQARALGRRVLFFGSSDLTHYGPRYEFVPAGVGRGGIDWAKAENDRRLLDFMISLDAERVVPEVREHQNACGPGAIAATMAACREMGATQGTVLEHTNSSEVMGARGEQMVDAVGYAAVVFA